MVILAQVRSDTYSGMLDKSDFNQTFPIAGASAENNEGGMNEEHAVGSVDGLYDQETPPLLHKASLFDSRWRRPYHKPTLRTYLSFTPSPAAYALFAESKTYHPSA